MCLRGRSGLRHWYFVEHRRRRRSLAGGHAGHGGPEIIIHVVGRVVREEGEDRGWFGGRGDVVVEDGLGFYDWPGVQ